MKTHRSFILTISILSGFCQFLFGQDNQLSENNKQLKNFFIMPQMGSSYYKPTDLNSSILNADSLITDMQLNDILSGSVALTFNLGHRTRIGKNIFMGCEAGLGLAFDTNEYTDPDSRTLHKGILHPAVTLLQNIFSRNNSIENVMAFKFRVIVGFLKVKRRCLNNNQTI